MRREIAQARNDVCPEVSAADSPAQVDRSCQHENPRGKKMQAAGPAVLVENVIGSHLTDNRPGVNGEGGARRPAAVFEVAAEWQLNERGCQVIACLAPVQSRMCH